MSASWASPAFVAPLQALYSFYSGAIGPKTVGGDGRRGSGASEGDLEGSVSLSGLSGFSPALFGASPAEVEATLHREVMQAAAQAAVQAAMAGVNPPDSVVRAKMDGAGATRAAARRGRRRGDRCTIPHTRPDGVGPDARGLGLPFELTSIRTNETTDT